jgi:hypothetical protein
VHRALDPARPGDPLRRDEDSVRPPPAERVDDDDQKPIDVTDVAVDGRRTLGADTEKKPPSARE